MTAFKNQFHRWIVLFWGLAMFCGASALMPGMVCGVAAEPGIGGGRVIVIDPGHGGHDRGAGTRAGMYEKDISLKLALALAEALRPDYRVVLTRTGDYHLDIARRASVANQHRADLFISLHLGGSLQRHVNQWEIYTYGNHPESARVHSEGNPDQAGHSALDAEEEAAVLWRDIQPRHETGGRNLAEALKTHLQTDPRIPSVTLRQAPLRVLEGVDAPAVVLEAGYLTNPTASDAITDPRFISDLAMVIRKAVDAYFQTGN